MIFTYFKLRDLVFLPLGGWYRHMGSAFLFPLLVTCCILPVFIPLFVSNVASVCVCRPTLCQGKETSGRGLECAVGPLKMLIKSEQIVASKINGGWASSAFLLLKGRDFTFMLVSWLLIPCISHRTYFSCMLNGLLIDISISIMFPGCSGAKVLWLQVNMALFNSQRMWF